MSKTAYKEDSRKLLAFISIKLYFISMSFTFTTKLSDVFQDFIQWKRTELAATFFATSTYVAKLDGIRFKGLG